MEHLDLEVATEFLLIAATLVELKTRRLLPGDDDLDLDDELALWEERDLLLARLLECKTFKDAAVVLARAGRRGRPRRARASPASTSASSTSRPTCSPASRPSDLRAAFLRAVAPKPVPARRPRPRRARSGRQRHRRRRGAARRAAPRRARSRSAQLTAGARRAARGRGALPRRARAVQAGPRRPRPGPHLRRHPDRLARAGDRSTSSTSLAAVDAYDG